MTLIIWLAVTLNQQTLTLDGVAEETVTYKENGKFFGDTSYKYDLFFAPEKHEGWVNIYKGNKRFTSSAIWPTEEEAKKLAGFGCIATVKIEWEE